MDNTKKAGQGKPKTRILIDGNRGTSKRPGRGQQAPRKAKDRSGITERNLMMEEVLRVVKTGTQRQREDAKLHLRLNCICSWREGRLAK